MSFNFANLAPSPFPDDPLARIACGWTLKRLERYQSSYADASIVEHFFQYACMLSSTTSTYSSLENPFAYHGTRR